MTNGTVPKPSIAYYDFFKINIGGAKDTVWYPEGPSMTRQEFADECDINKLMARYDTHVIGGPGNLPPMQPMYVDFTEMPRDLLGYMEFMENAQASFMTLPAVVRKEFDNDALQFVEFASDPGNLDQMRSWGLAPPAEAPKADVEPPTAAKAEPPQGGSAGSSTQSSS